MQVIEFVKQNGWDALAARGIDIRDYPEQQIKVLNYNQLEAKKDDPVACECRSLVLDYSGNLVSRSFSRFFNLGEMGTQDFDFSNCDVREKADGSLTNIYWCPQTDRWEIRTRSMAFAEANHAFGTKTDCTFREAILDAMHFTEDQFQACMNSIEFHKSCTYIMEYTSPFNRIVTRYEKPEMVLLSVMSNLTGIESNDAGQEQWVKILQEKGMNVRLARQYQAFSADQLLSMAESLTDLQEGFVVKDRNTGWRVKVKSRAYLVAHKLRGENGVPTLSNIMELVLTGEDSEFLSYFEEWKCLFEPVQDALTLLKNDIVDVLTKNQYHETQKDFALAVKDLRCAPVMFKARKEGAGAVETFESMDLNQQMKILEKYVS